MVIINYLISLYCRPSNNGKVRQYNKPKSPAMHNQTKYAKSQKINKNKDMSRQIKVKKETVKK